MPGLEGDLEECKPKRSVSPEAKPRLTLTLTCYINFEGDRRKYIIAIIQSECMISAGGTTIYNINIIVH